MRNLHLLLSYVVPVKSKAKISQNFVAFSEYLKFNENITKKLIKILQVGYFTLQQLCENSLQRQTQDLSKFQFSFEIAIATCFFGTISIIRQHIFENFLTHPPEKI